MHVKQNIADKVVTWFIVRKEQTGSPTPHMATDSRRQTAFRSVFDPTTKSPRHRLWYRYLGDGIW
jgi:hypothetical protein